MRYLVLGDIHGNRPALTAVMDAARSRRVDAGLFVGDLVGYGPEPLACIRMLRQWPQAGELKWVAGNHDLVACETVPTEGYIPEAVQTLEWTRRQLLESPADHDFLRAARTTCLVAEKICLTHDSLLSPGSGTYQRNLEQSAHELQALREAGGRVGFYGHTHKLRAEICTPTGYTYAHHLEPHVGPGLDPHPLLLLPHEAAWIGAGSVGLPLNRARQAEFLILDTNDANLWLVEAYAVAYPRQETRAQMQEQLPAHCDAAVVETITRWL